MQFASDPIHQWISPEARRRSCNVALLPRLVIGGTIDQFAEHAQKPRQVIGFAHENVSTRLENLRRLRGRRKDDDRYVAQFRHGSDYPADFEALYFGHA